MKTCPYCKKVNEGPREYHADCWFGWLVDYDQEQIVRPATPAEGQESDAALAHDGGCGIILVDGSRCYVD